MTRWFKRGTGKTDDPGRDTRIAEALKVLDPAGRDAGYWLRFHNVVMARAGRELAHRRVMAGLTVGDVLVSWARAVVPTAVAAAAVAVLVLTRTGTGPVHQPADVEDLLLSDVPAESVPGILSTSDGSVVFASFSSDNIF